MEFDRIVPLKASIELPEDLNLVDVLWRQDLDLGIGKEVFDPVLRQEIERQHQLELLKEREKQKTEEAERQRIDREKQAHAQQWLQQNYSRDGETGEWVPRQKENDTAQAQSTNNDLSLEEALEYIFNTSLESGNLSLGTDDFTVPQTLESGNGVDFVVPDSDYNNYTQFQQQVQPQEVPTITTPHLDFDSTSANILDDLITLLGAPTPGDDTVAPPDDEEVFLLHNSTMPSVVNDSSNTTCQLPLPDLNSSLPMSDLNSTMPALPTLPPLDLPLDDLLLDNMTSYANESLMEVEALLPSLTDSGMIDMDAGLDDPTPVDDTDTHSQVSLGSNSPSQEFNDTFEGLEGATGGSDYPDYSSSAPYTTRVSHTSESSSDSGFPYHSGSSSYSGSPSSNYGGNFSSSSNDTDHNHSIAQQHVAHNHTYPTQPGQTPREVKKYAQKDPSKSKSGRTRDHRRAEELKVPFTVEEIIESPVETFNDMLTKYKLTEAQLALIKDIRRRGKNKIAAQNCRKRKVGVILTLEDEMGELQRQRDRLRSERVHMEQETRLMKERYSQLYSQIFQNLRDEHGQPYDPSSFTLQQLTGGDIILVPRNISVPTGGSTGSAASSPSTLSSSSHSSSASKAKGQKRRKGDQ